jgi:serine/threonine protein phosphatase PrpC
MWIPLHKRPSFAVTRKNARLSKEDKEDMLLGNYFLHSPKTDKLHGLNTVLNGIEVGHSSIQGYRPNMEDAFIMQCMDGLADHILLAILDGHAGKGASEYFSSHVPQAIYNTRQYEKYVQMNPKDRSEQHGIDTLSAALVQAYIDIDESYFNYEQKDNSGSTLICAVITPTHVLCSNVGDSRCVVGTSDGKAISMSEDHKPSLDEEKRRIVAAGEDGP